MKSSVILRTDFSCAHFYKIESWTDEQNLNQFGKCFSEHGHGHDYVLEIECSLDQENSIRAKLHELKEKLDHKHLNFIIHEFKSQVPTTENLALFCKKFIETEDSNPLIRLKLYEHSDLWVELI